MRPSGTAKLALKLGFSALLLTLLLWQLDLDMLRARLARADLGFVALAVFTLLVAQLLSAVRWAWIARGLGLEVYLPRKVAYYFLGMFLSLFLPSIVGGDVARAYLVARDRERKGWEAAASVILERTNGLYALTLVATGSMLFLELPALWWWLWLGGVAAAWLAMLTYRRWHALLPRLLRGWRELPLTEPCFRRVWWLSLPLSILFQILLVQAHVFLAGAVGLELSWAALGFIVCVVAVAAALPISFNGFGVREGGYVGLAAYLGGAADAAAAMAALWVVVLVIASLPGAVVFWRLGGIRGVRGR